MGLFRDDNVYEERDEIQRNKTNRANKIVLEKIKKQYEVRVDNAIETGCDDDVLEGYREDYEFVRRLLDVQELLESSRVKYSQQHYYWEVYIKGEKVA